MRAADPPVSYLVGTPKGRLSKLEKDLVALPWQAVREGVNVKLLPKEQELYVLAQSLPRIHKERAMRRRQLKWLWTRLKQISAMKINRKELLMKLGDARGKARAAWRLIEVKVAAEGTSLTFTLNREKTTPGPATRRTLSSAYQSLRQGSCPLVAVLYSAC